MNHLFCFHPKKSYSRLPWLFDGGRSFSSSLSLPRQLKWMIENEKNKIQSKELILPVQTFLFSWTPITIFIGWTPTSRGIRTGNITNIITSFIGHTRFWSPSSTWRWRWFTWAMLLLLLLGWTIIFIALSNLERR